MRLILKECLLTFFLSGAMLGQSLPSAQGQSSLASTHADNSVATPTAQTPPAPAPASSKHKLGPLEISVNWRTRAEGWNWFEGNTGNSDYGLWNSLLRVGIGQTGESFDWFIEGEQPSILGLPNDAVVAAPQGQLGLGGTYYAANNNHTNEANGFVKQAFVNFKHLGPAAFKMGRFEYFDGAEVKPSDPLLATLIQTRISSRLVSNFGFSAVQRAFDGVQMSLNSGQNNWTFVGARPTQGVFQVKGMDELDVDLYSGAYTRFDQHKTELWRAPRFRAWIHRPSYAGAQNRQPSSRLLGRPIRERSRLRLMAWTTLTYTTRETPESLISCCGERCRTGPGEVKRSTPRRLWARPDGNCR